MARRTGDINISQNFHLGSGLPLRDTEIVDTLADLTDLAVIPMVERHAGMRTWVLELDKAYHLLNNLTTWEPEGTGSGGGGGIPDDGSVTNAKLATDVKVGSIAALNIVFGTALTTIQAFLTNLFTNKVDKTTTVNGHSLTGNVVVAPTDLTQDSTHRFTTDVEKAAWNAKQDAIGYTPENQANKATNLSSNDNVHYPTTAATKSADDQTLIDAKAYTDASIIGGFSFRGVWDPTITTYPNTGGRGVAGVPKAGDAWEISVAANGYDQGDIVIAKIDTPGQTASNWGTSEHNTQQSTESIRGTAKIATQAIIQDENSTNDTDVVTSKKFWQGIARFLAIKTTDNIAEGVTNLYFTASRAIASVLTGLAAASGTLAATDTILQAFNKVKYFIDNFSSTIRTITAAWTFSDLVTFSNAINEAKAADVASATTTNIGAATGNYVNITGTTTITAFDTIQAGTRRIVTFSGILILTHNATSLILPTSANITTAAGDTAVFISLGSGNWKCASYTRADGTTLAIANNSITQPKLNGFAPNTPVAYSGSTINFDLTGKTVFDYREITAINGSPTINLNNSTSGLEILIRLDFTAAGTFTVTLGSATPTLTFKDGGATIATISFTVLSGDIKFIPIFIDGTTAIVVTENNLSTIIKQGGNAFNTTIALGSTDANDVSMVVNTIEKLRLINAAGVMFTSGGSGSGIAALFRNTSLTQLLRLLDNGKLMLGIGTPTSRLHLVEDATVNLLRLETETTGVNPICEYRAQRRIATTDATTTTLDTIATTTDSILTIIGFVNARRTGGASGTSGDGAAYKIEAVYKNVGGTVTLIGGGITPIGESVGAYDCQLNISSANILIQVIGVATTNITWHSSLIQTMEVTT